VSIPGRVIIAHLGNARCYRFRGDERVLLTRPHTALAELGHLDNATPFATHNRHLLTRALGLESSTRPDIAEHLVEPGDLLLLVNAALSWAVEARPVGELIIEGASPSTVASSIARWGDRSATPGAVVVVRIGAAKAALPAAGTPQ
jgi:protein phosphatase